MYLESKLYECWTTSFSESHMTHSIFTASCICLDICYFIHFGLSNVSIKYKRIINEYRFFEYEVFWYSRFQFSVLKKRTSRNQHGLLDFWDYFHSLKFEFLTKAHIFADALWFMFMIISSLVGSHSNRHLTVQ